MFSLIVDRLAAKKTKFTDKLSRVKDQDEKGKGVIPFHSLSKLKMKKGWISKLLSGRIFMDFQDCSIKFRKEVDYSLSSLSIKYLEEPFNNSE